MSRFHIGLLLLGLTLTSLSASEIECFGNGVKKDGRCECNPGFFGKKCECTDPYYDNACMRSDGIVCSGRGICVCGLCQCHNSYGENCECTDDSCSYFHNVICGGHGKCRCGTCHCDTGFRGDACEISTDTSRCLSSNGKICNDRGECFSNQCRCNGYFKGRTCEECPTCAGPCERSKKCAVCMYNASDVNACVQNCSGINITVVEALGNSTDDRVCLFRQSDSLLRFTYSEDADGKFLFKIQRHKQGGGKHDKSSDGSRMFSLWSLVWLILIAVIRLL